MCRWLLAAVAAVVVLAPAQAVRAESLAAARKAVDSSDYPTARTELDAVLKAGKSSPEELAEIYKLTGIVEAALGDPQGATSAFLKWLSLDAKAALPFGTSPKMMKPFTAAETEAKKHGLVEAKAETEDDPPTVTLVVVNDPQKLIAGARVYFKVDKRAEQTLSADGTDRVKIELETGKRLDLRLQAVDQYGNRVVELGSKDVPIVITSSGQTKRIVDPNDVKLVKQKPVEHVTPRPWYLQWWVWGISSVVVTGVGGYFAYRTHDDINQLDTLNANSYAHPWQDAQDVESRARRDLLVTNISAGVAGVFALGTAILYLTRPQLAETETSATVTPVPGGGAVVLGGHF